MQNKIKLTDEEEAELRVEFGDWVSNWAHDKHAALEKRFGKEALFEREDEEAEVLQMEFYSDVQRAVEDVVRQYLAE
jgi:hypothetical protein